MPATGSFLLDTNIVIHLLNQIPAVQARAPESQQFHVPIIAVGEIAYGAAKSSRPEANWSSLEEFLKQNTIHCCDLEVARQLGSHPRYTG